MLVLVQDQIRGLAHLTRYHTPMACLPLGIEPTTNTDPNLTLLLRGSAALAKITYNLYSG